MAVDALTRSPSLNPLRSKSFNRRRSSTAVTFAEQLALARSLSEQPQQQQQQHPYFLAPLSFSSASSSSSSSSSCSPPPSSSSSSASLFSSLDTQPICLTPNFSSVYDEDDPLYMLTRSTSSRLTSKPYHHQHSQSWDGSTTTNSSKNHVSRMVDAQQLFLTLSRSTSCAFLQPSPVPLNKTNTIIEESLKRRFFLPGFRKHRFSLKKSHWKQGPPPSRSSSTASTMTLGTIQEQRC